MSKSRVIKIRVTAEDKKRWREAASAEGLTTSEWVRRQAWGRAVETEPLVREVKAARARLGKAGRAGGRG